jgi:hypothetical protein
MENHPLSQPEFEEDDYQQHRTLNDEQIKTMLEILRELRKIPQRPEYDDNAGC